LSGIGFPLPRSPFTGRPFITKTCGRPGGIDDFSCFIKITKDLFGKCRFALPSGERTVESNLLFG
jgi:hypothetical protein